MKRLVFWRRLGDPHERHFRDVMMAYLPQIIRIDDYVCHAALTTAVRDGLPWDAVKNILLQTETPLVVVKPNWVQESHESLPDVWESVISHPNLVLAVVEVVAEALRGRGTICLCDAPHTYAIWDSIVSRGDLKSRFEALRIRFPSLNVELLDLRRETWIRKEQVVVERRHNPHDPRGYAQLNLGKDSLFYQHKGEGHYYGADYDTGVINSHHHGALHEYLLAGTPIACDLFVNVPKLKTHKKTGITCCLKNLVGVNGDKNWLPHHTEGGPRADGDEFPTERLSHSIERYIKSMGRQVALKIPVLGTWAYRKARNVGKAMLGDSDVVVRNGNWYGNDTCWRMCLDLNRALLYGNLDGSWRGRFQPKQYLAVVDGIVGGEGNGPLCPDPVQSGVIICGDNSASIDAVACRLMGYDPADIPLVANAFAEHTWPIARCPLNQVTAFDARVGHEIPLSEIAPAVPGGFKPHFGWKKLRGGK